MHGLHSHNKKNCCTTFVVGDDGMPDIDSIVYPITECPGEVY